MNKVQIITLKPDRWPEYKALRLRALQQAAPAFGSSFEEEQFKADEAWRERLENTQKQDGNFIFFAEVENCLVGMMGVYRPNQLKVAHIANIYGVFVDEAKRGQGIGRLLLDAALQEINRYPDYLKIALGVNTQQAAACALYQKAGFEIVGSLKKEVRIGDQFYDEYVMEKLL